MSYNVGPDFTFQGESKYYCEQCDSVTYPEWDGCEGEFRCPNCYEPTPEGAGDDKETLASACQVEDGKDCDCPHHRQ